MVKLTEASDVVCLLTSFSAARPWILYEAGVAKGRMGVSLYGVAIGVPLSDLSTGPFAHFQNCGDDVESLTSLVMQLLRRIPDADPQRGSVEGQVRTFREAAAKVLEDPTRTGATEEPSAIERASQMFEEIKAAINDLAKSAASQAQARALGPSLFQQVLLRERDERKKPLGFLIITGLLRDEFPWLFQLGREIWTASDDEAYAESVRRFNAALELTLKLPMLAQHSGSLQGLQWLRSNLRL